MVVPSVRTTTCDNLEQGRHRYVRNASDMNDTAENESIADQGDRSRAFASATELVVQLAQREISSRELLEIYLGRIDRSPSGLPRWADEEPIRSTSSTHWSNGSPQLRQGCWSLPRSG